MATRTIAERQAARRAAGIEIHKIVARTKDGRYVTHVTLSGDWDRVQKIWQLLDDARRAGKLPLVDYLAVRSDEDPDPRWAQAESDLVPFFVGRLKGHRDGPTSSGWSYQDGIQQAAKAWGLKHGYEGRGGGWIYISEQNRPYTQGWRSLEENLRLRKQGYLVEATIDGERRVYANDLADL